MTRESLEIVDAYWGSDADRLARELEEIISVLRAHSLLLPPEESDPHPSGTSDALVIRN